MGYLWVIYSGFLSNLNYLLILYSLPRRMFDKFSTGNFYLREQGTPEQGMRKEEHTEHTKTIKSSLLLLQGEGWGVVK
jgi:hypothetical protein